MRQSARAKRMAKHRMRLNHVPKLNLVPLIDCFTLLIFFLLINYSADVEVLQVDKSIKLPASVSETTPGESVVVTLNSKDILVQGRRVGGIDELAASTEAKFKPLEDELKYLAGKSPSSAELYKDEGRPITILGDKSIPYAQLKKIMSTCVAADYRKIALAVTHTEATISKETSN